MCFSKTHTPAQEQKDDLYIIIIKYKYKKCFLLDDNHMNCISGKGGS